MKKQAKLEAVIGTREHMELVRNGLNHCIRNLMHRGENHDRSKLGPEELPIFAEYTQRLRWLTYGSDEYKQCLEEMGPALRHHYACNSHHPEHHDKGIEGMDLFDLVEMFVDWWASCQRHDDGDLDRSIDVNEKRFGMSPQLAAIFRNTAARMPFPPKK